MKEKYIKDFISKIRDKKYLEALNKKVKPLGFIFDPKNMSDSKLKKQAELFYQLDGC